MVLRSSTDGRRAEFFARLLAGVHLLGDAEVIQSAAPSSSQHFRIRVRRGAGRAHKNFEDPDRPTRRGDLAALAVPEILVVG